MRPTIAVLLAAGIAGCGAGRKEVDSGGVQPPSANVAHIARADAAAGNQNDPALTNVKLIEQSQVQAARRKPSFWTRLWRALFPPRKKDPPRPPVGTFIPDGSQHKKLPMKRIPMKRVK